MKLIGSIFFGAIILVAVAIGFYFSSSNYQNKVVCDTYEVFLDIEFSNIVEDKYLDQKHHMNRTIKINNREIIFTLDESGFYEFVNEGDSLSKEKGNPKIEVYRQGQYIRAFKIDLGCEK